jgi:23S rRNA pseudouridine1911/1915/1917 synthase
MAVKNGLVSVNGMRFSKPGTQIKPGDLVVVDSLPEPPPLRANPEAIPLDIVYEDDQLLVVNKAAGMVVHLSAGHHSGTLVNAVLHHCGISSGLFADDEGDDAASDTEGEGEDEVQSMWQPPESSIIRPGIVHRIDKGTTGLLVVAKTSQALGHLSDQFKNKTVGREYFSITIGCPDPSSGRIETNIDRDPNERKRMASLALGARGRRAASNYEVKEVLANGSSAVVSWRLETGRTHQIRVHSKHKGCPLLGDETYGGTASAAANNIAKGRPARQALIRTLVASLARPALHARTLEFEHPTTKERMKFSCEIPSDLADALTKLREL